MKTVFIDRDGTIITEPPDEQVDSLEKLEMIPGAIQGLQIMQNQGYALVMVTNQDNLGSKSYPAEKYGLVQGKLLKLLAGEGITFQAVFVCPHNAGENCGCRKPKTGLVDEYIRKNEIDLSDSFVFGDRETDVELARNIGCKAVRLTADRSTKADFAAEHFIEASRFIARQGRSATISRKTAETNILVDIFLDGTGTYEIGTGIGFFDHMLAQLSKHSGIDMKIRVDGDLRVDEHHTIEDTGLVIGEAVNKALGKKFGIERYGFVLPMDEALAKVAIDIGGRTYCSFKAKFKREKIGDFPSELAEDFFRAFADGLKCNLHIEAAGRNDHHKMEAVFKAVARALGQAVRQSDRNSQQLPSTKGVI